MRQFASTVRSKIAIVQNVLENKPSSPATSLPASPAGNNILVKTKKNDFQTPVYNQKINYLAVAQCVDVTIHLNTL